MDSLPLSNKNNYLTNKTIKLVKKKHNVHLSVY